MKTNKLICTTKCKYLRPELETTDAVVERGFATSIEFVEKDEEVEF